MHDFHPTGISSPENIHLVDAKPTSLAIEWTPPPFNCSDVKYLIEGSENCGVCTNFTTFTRATCNGMSIDGRSCNLSVQSYSEVCGVLSGTESDPFIITIKGIILLVITVTVNLENET